MADQVVKLRSVGNTSILQLSEDTPRHAEAKVTHVFSSPESLLVRGSRWRKLLLENDFVNNILAIVVDEAHSFILPTNKKICIVKW